MRHSWHSQLFPWLLDWSVLFRWAANSAKRPKLCQPRHLLAWRKALNKAERSYKLVLQLISSEHPLARCPLNVGRSDSQLLRSLDTTWLQPAKGKRKPRPPAQSLSWQRRERARSLSSVCRMNGACHRCVLRRRRVLQGAKGRLYIASAAASPQPRRFGELPRDFAALHCMFGADVAKKNSLLRISATEIAVVGGNAVRLLGACAGLAVRRHPTSPDAHCPSRRPHERYQSVHHRHGCGWCGWRGSSPQWRVPGAGRAWWPATHPCVPSVRPRRDERLGWRHGGAVHRPGVL